MMKKPLAIIIACTILTSHFTRFSAAATGEESYKFIVFGLSDNDDSF